MKIRKAFAICLTSLLVAATGCGANKPTAPASSGADLSEAGGSSSGIPGRQFTRDIELSPVRSRSGKIAIDRRNDKGKY